VPHARHCYLGLLSSGPVLLRRQKEETAMTLTPSATSSAAAGFTFYGMVWLALMELDDLAKILHISSWVKSRSVLRWIIEHKSVALICTECFNYSVHGITQSIAVTFALGGTACNALMIWAVLPVLNKIRGPRWLYGGLK
jgi:hypothetical protein